MPWLFYRFCAPLKIFAPLDHYWVKNVTPKIYRSYPIKGRTQLIEIQKNVRNKSTIVFQKCSYAGVFQGEYAHKPRRMPIRPYEWLPARWRT